MERVPGPLTKILEWTRASLFPVKFSSSSVDGDKRHPGGAGSGQVALPVAKEEAILRGKPVLLKKLQQGLSLRSVSAAVNDVQMAGQVAAEQRFFKLFQGRVGESVTEDALGAEFFQDFQASWQERCCEHCFSRQTS